MCGIFCHVSRSYKNNSEVSSEWYSCKDLIVARGPDNVAERIERLNEDWSGHFAASVLWMQGFNLSVQPIVDSTGNILLWNGDVFSETLAEDNICDTDVILASLQSSSNIIDIIGRHSLLLKTNTDENNLTLMSVGDKRIKEDQYDVPDRKTGKQTFSELLNICPKRKWNFVEVNITQAELQQYRSSRICHLLYPLCTVLDESLGCAVWFASRAIGTLSTSSCIYESPCRVLLLGMGADELFGGYMRHRTILKHKGWNALAEELSIELARISERNLGRDDRIVSDHGKQSRLPYLDEHVVEYVQQLKPWERCYPTDKMPSGLGDKLLLRLLAYKLGFQNTATFPKRAFQFGSRIANSKENAKDISDRL
ncbi:asparagine synthetase domain-containing protein 1 isoform X4 [Megalopta genalis]|uniref:asparagine synthetase domain-containing protein 1 isoform X4 n=1 Tax=Megalopta genalis TaxID=115081 RepID=UPI003FCF86FB